MKIKVTFILIIICRFYGFIYSQNNDFSDQNVFILELPDKDSIPILFAKGIVSTNYAEFGITISPDLSEIFFTRRGANENQKLGEIMVMKKIDNRWTLPFVANFSGKYNDMEPLITPDGNMLIFGSNRPIKEGGKPDQFNQWYLEKTDTGWSVPKLFIPLYNRGFVMYPTMANNKNLYYTSMDGIYKLRYNEGNYEEPEKLTDLINRYPRAAHPCISPDESYIIFDAQPRGDMKSDLFISYNDDGNWSEPKKLNEEINSSESNAIAFITYNREFLFFVRNGDIYWIRTKNIEEIPIDNIK